MDVYYLQTEDEFVMLNISLFVSNSTSFFDQYLHSETENYLASKSSF